MKKILYLVSIILFITSIVLINSVDATFTMTMNVSSSPTSIQVGDEGSSM